jgi:APA family basic amino acid/polyamine antiporter
MIHLHGSGRIVHNFLAGLKVSAIVVFIALGLSLGTGSLGNLGSSHQVALPATGWLLALVPVMFSYSGWNAAAYVAEEVRDPNRNLPWSLALGTFVVVVIYLALNLLYLYAMPLADLAAVTGGLTDLVAERLFGFVAGNVLAIFTIVSIAASISAMVLAGPRVYYAMARDGVFFRRMAEVHPRWRTPAFSLIAQGIWAGVLALSGRYDQLFTYVMFMMVLSYAATVVGLFVLRRKLPDAPRPYRCTGYPWLPLLYVIIGGLFALNAAAQRPKEALAGAAIVLLGVPGYVYWKRTKPGAHPLV